MKTAEQIQTQIEALQPGKTTSYRTSQCYASVRPARDGATGYEVEAGWAVHEAMDDDYLSCTYHPLSRPAPWMGRRKVVPASAEAAALYVRWRDSVMTRAGISEGEAIGSVSRA